MMKVHTRDSNATGRVLRWMVAKAAGLPIHRIDQDGIWIKLPSGNVSRWAPDIDWNQGGPIIASMDYCQESLGRASNPEKQFYCSSPSVAEEWHTHPVRGYGSTPLIAAMRCYA